MKRQDRPAHELPSFARYLNKVFDFRAIAATLTDSRGAPEISPSAVFLAVFHGFAFRLPSFQQLEAELTQPALQQWIGASAALTLSFNRYAAGLLHWLKVGASPNDVQTQVQRRVALMALNIYTQPITESIGRCVEALDAGLRTILNTRPGGSDQ